MIRGACEREKNVDGAPGVQNVVRRIDGLEYYAIETFHSSPFYSKTTPVFIKDIVNSISIFEVYGYNAMSIVQDNVILLKNHPVRKVRVTGRIREYFLKEMNEKQYYFLSIDDSSGAGIVVKLTKGALFAGGLNNQCIGYLVEITGSVKMFNERYEIHGDAITVLNNGEDYMQEEMKFWKDALQVREVLRCPWYQMPQNSDLSDPYYRVDHGTHRRKQCQRNINLDPSTDPDPSFALDSSIHITRKKRTTFRSGIPKRLEKVSENALLESPAAKSQDENTLWMSISDKTHFDFKKSTLEEKLVLLLFKWIVKNEKSEFELNQLYKDPTVASFLDLMAKERFPLQTVDLSLPGFKIKSVTDIKGELFHDSRHKLQECRLIKCAADKNCFCDTTLQFSQYLVKQLRRYKINKEVLYPQSLVAGFNKKYSQKLHIDDFLLNRIIFWLLKSQKDFSWKYSKDDDAWLYLKEHRK